MYASTIKEPHKHIGRGTEFLFRTGLAIKGVDAILETIGGFLLLSPVKASEWLTELSQHELYKEHANAARHLQHAADRVGAATPLAAGYLIVHGLAKVILILAVFKNKIWGYKGLIGVLSFFTVVEVIRAIQKHESLPLIMAALDAAIVFLIAKEYRARFTGGVEEGDRNSESPPAGSV